MERGAGHYRFPLFIDISGSTVVLVGGGRVAARRAGTLALFGCRILVIAPELRFDMPGVTWIPRAYRSGDLEGAALAVAATDDRQVNRQVGLDARALGIPVSVADRPEECSFFFPAVCAEGELVAGLVSTGQAHEKTAQAARRLRQLLKEL